MIKKCAMLGLVCLLTATVSASVVWSAGGVDNNWNTADNWTGSGAPDTYHKIKANASTAETGPVIDAGNVGANSILAASIALGLENGGTSAMYLTMTGGEASAKEFRVGAANNGKDGYGIFNMSGGIFNANRTGGDDIIIGYTTDTALSSRGEMTMTGGIINTDSVMIGRDDNTTARLYLYGGTINANNLLIGDKVTEGNTPDTLMDITTGQMLITGDLTGRIDSYINNGFIIGYGAAANVRHSYDSVADITTLYAVPEPATLVLLGLGGIVLRKRR